MESYVNPLHSYLKMNTLIQHICEHYHNFFYLFNEELLVSNVAVHVGSVTATIFTPPKCKHVRRFPLAYSNRAWLTFGTSLPKLPRIRHVLFMGVYNHGPGKQ